MGAGFVSSNTSFWSYPDAEQTLLNENYAPFFNKPQSAANFLFYVGVCGGVRYWF